MSVELHPPTRSRNCSIHMDPGTGRMYEYDESTGDTAWLDEDRIPVIDAATGAAPAERQSKSRLSIHVDDASGRKYEYNEMTGETRWLEEVQNVSAAQSVKERVAARKAQRQSEEKQSRKGFPNAAVAAALVSPQANTLNMVNNPLASVAASGGAAFKVGTGPLGVRPDERVLLEEKWKNALCCCFSCCDDRTQAVAEALSGGRSPGNHLIITDRQLIHRKEEFMLPRCCCSFCACPVHFTQIMDLDEVNAVQTTENKCIGNAGLCYVYTIWFFFGILGAHYWAYSKRFPRTIGHKIYLVTWFLTLGFGGIGWLIDAFRIYKWVSPFTIQLHAWRPEADTFIDIRSQKSVRAIRNGLYTALAPQRQIDPRRYVSPDPRTANVPGTEQFRAATSGPNAVDSLGVQSGATSHDDANLQPFKKTKLIVTGDRLLMHHHKTKPGTLNVFTEVFLKDLQGVELSEPARWPTWYAWVWLMPPWGCCACHRKILGVRSCTGIWLYRFTCGYMGIGWLVDMFTMCCCIHRLRTMSELRIVMNRADDLGLDMKLVKSDHGHKIRDALAGELRKSPVMSRDPSVAQYHHVQQSCPLERCKSCNDNVVRDTTLDALRITVDRVHKTKKKMVCIPPSPCCPTCWLLPCVCIFPCCCFKPICMGICSCCFIASTDKVQHDVYHSKASQNINLVEMPMTSIDRLIKVWLMGGLCGCHAFMTRRFARARIYIFLWFMILSPALAALVNNVDAAIYCSRSRHLAFKSDYETYGNKTQRQLQSRSCQDPDGANAMCQSALSTGEQPRPSDPDYCTYLRDAYQCMCMTDCAEKPGMASREALNQRFNCNLQQCAGDAIAGSEGGYSFGDCHAEAVTRRNNWFPIGNIFQASMCLLVLLWVYDLTILRSYLEVCAINFGATDTFGPAALAVWSEEWACYLNTREESQQALGLLRLFNQAYQKHNKRRVVAPLAVPATALHTN